MTTPREYAIGGLISQHAALQCVTPLASCLLALVNGIDRKLPDTLSVRRDLPYYNI